MLLENKVLVVTGANGNLGRAVVSKALEEGAKHIYMLDVNFSDGLPRERVSQHVVDLMDQAATASSFKAFGDVDALCNTAGGFTMGQTAFEASDDEWDRMYKLNVRTMLNTVRAVVPGMVSRKSGSIVNIGAAGALAGSALMAPYIVSKSAVIRITESLSAELKDNGINVNCVLPSVIDTPPNRAAMADADFSSWVSPEQLANTICFLASDSASGIHGASIPVKNRV